MDVAKRHGLADSLLSIAAAARKRLVPCDSRWLSTRLSAMMLAHGHERDETRLTAWLAETQRLLSDLPQDILSDAIDTAIKRSERGFLPSVGEIRAIADPAVAQRKMIIERIESIDRLLTPTPARSLPAPRQPEPEYCTPEQAAAILREFGLKRSWL